MFRVWLAVPGFPAKIMEILRGILIISEYGLFQYLGLQNKARIYLIMIYCMVCKIDLSI